jgi:hypothetical protein
MTVDQALHAAHIVAQRWNCLCARHDCLHCACRVLAEEVEKLRHEAHATVSRMHCRHCGMDLVDGICGTCDR